MSDDVQGWWEAELLVSEWQAEDAGAALLEFGVDGVEIIGPDEFAPELPGSAPRRPPPPAGFAHLVVSCGKPQSDAPPSQDAIDDVLRGVGVCLAAGTQVQWHYRVDQDWAHRWKHYFKPLQVGKRTWIIPSWEVEHVQQLPPESIALVLDPGLAFGTGQHATTALCLRACEDLWCEDGAQMASAPILDLGCGSGILAIALAKLGCTHVMATDNDPVAVRVAQENSERNGVAECVRTSTHDVEQLPECYHGIVANILAVTLVALAPQIIGKLQPGGWLVLSGILESQQDDVWHAYQQAAAAQGRALVRHTTMIENEWVAMVLRNPLR